MACTHLSDPQRELAVGTNHIETERIAAITLDHLMAVLQPTIRTFGIGFNNLICVVRTGGKTVVLRVSNDGFV